MYAADPALPLQKSHPGVDDLTASKFINTRKTPLAWQPCAVPATGPSSRLWPDAETPCHSTSVESCHINIAT